MTSLFIHQDTIDALYEAYGAALRHGHLAVDYALPQGVTAEVGGCECHRDECFFCGAEIAAMFEASYEDELEDWREKHDPDHPLYGL